MLQITFIKQENFVTCDCNLTSYKLIINAKQKSFKKNHLAIIVQCFRSLIILQSFIKRKQKLGHCVINLYIVAHTSLACDCNCIQLCK